jgi:predicted signal transduction protein with EAL and GGDEF domain
MQHFRRKLGEDMVGADQVAVPIRRRLVELMFTALSSIVLIVLGHTIAGITMWMLTAEPLALVLTLIGLAVGGLRIVLCLCFARRNRENETTASLDRWVLLYGLGGAVYSSTLASLVGLAFHLKHEEAALLCLTVAMCYIVGMIIRVAVIPAAARLQLLALLLPIIVCSALRWEPSYIILALLLAMFCVGGLQLIQHMHRTILSRLEAEQMLSRMAFTDHLTQLPNRSMFEQIGEKWRDQALAKGERFVVAALDLDGFKAINDTFGHDAGDLLLQTVARRMKQVLPALISSRDWVAMSLPSYLRGLSRSMGRHIWQSV